MPKIKLNTNKVSVKSSVMSVRQKSDRKAGVKRWPGGKPDFQRSKDDNRNKSRYTNKAKIKAAEIEKQREEAKLEKEKRVAEYKKKRLQKAKIFTKRTRKGQPVMKDRMEFLLKQIQEMTGKS